MISSDRGRRVARGGGGGGQEENSEGAKQTSKFKHTTKVSGILGSDDIIQLSYTYDDSILGPTCPKGVQTLGVSIRKHPSLMQVESLKQHNVPRHTNG